MAGELTLLAAVRVAAFVAVAPLTGHQRIPLWIRSLLAVAIALALAPLASSSAPPSGPACPPGELLGRGLSELMTGLMLGLGVLVLVEAGAMGGQILAHMSGLAWPTSELEESSPASQLVWMLSLVVFVLMRGPELMLTTLAETFVSLPPGRVGEGSGQLAFVVELLNHSFWLAIRGVAPAVAALWIAVLAVTILVRVLPQAGCLQLGMDAGLATFWLAMLLTVCGGVWIWMDDLESWMSLLRQRLLATAAASGS